MLRRPLAVLALLALAACSPLAGFDDGNAQVELTRGDEAPLLLSHDPLLSSVTMTPPVEGVVELVFTHQDPFVEIAVQVDANQLSEGDVVSLPVSGDELFVSVRYDDAEFVSSAAGASGTVELSVLEVSESSADLIAELDVTLPASDPGSGETVTASGFLEGSYGEPAAVDEDEGDLSANVDLELDEG